MNQRDLAELKRRLNPQHRNPTVIRGCYVTGDGQVISTFVQSLHGMPDAENEKYMAIFRKTLSGTQGQNLLPVEFAGAKETEAHRLLMTLRDSALKDDAAVDSFFEKVVAYIRESGVARLQSVDAQQAADHYLVLLMHDGYDVPYRDKNDEADMDRSTDVFHYILCGVCPVKQTKSTLSYFATESEFHSREADWVVGAPELGFLFPAFEERSANIYGAMYYTRDIADLHDDFVRGVLGQEPVMPAQEQKETFQTLLQETLGEECSLDVMQAVHETVSTMIEERKADRHADPLTLTGQDVRNVLQDCGVSEEKAAAFQEQYGQAFGQFAEIPAVNVVTPRQFVVNTPSVSIHVDPEHSDLIETRVIDGKRYILVLADGNVEVNGVSVAIQE